MKLFFLLSTFTINAPFNNPPLWTNPELSQVHNHPSQSAQQMPYGVYVPIEYSYDPASSYIPYMDMQTSYYQHTHNVPIQTHLHVQSHSASNMVPTQMQTIHQHMPHHQLHVHHQPILTTPLTYIQTDAHHHTLNHGMQPSIHVVHQHIPYNHLFVNQQPSMTHSTNHVPPHIQHQYMSHFPDSPVYMTHYYNPEHTTLAHTMVQPQSIVQENIAVLKEHDPSTLTLQDNPVVRNQNSNKNSDDPILGINKLQDHPSSQNPPETLEAHLPMPEYEKTIEKLYELAYAAKTLAHNPERRIVLRKIKTIAEKCLLLCISNILMKKAFISHKNSLGCCRRHLRKGRSDIELFIACGEYNKIFLNITPKDVSNLKAIFPPVAIPFVNFVVPEQD